MREIIYESTAAKGLSSEEVFRIVYRSKQSNIRNGLSGFLVYSQGRFLQLLEGDDLALRKTLNVIEQDLRHRDFRVISERPINAPSFPDWHMRRVADSNCEIARTDVAKALGGAIPSHVDAALHEFFGTTPETSLVADQRSLA